MSLSTWLGLAGALLALACASQAEAATPAQIVSSLNQQRAASGIPAGIVERSDWSSSCALHNRYMQETGQFEHEEDPSNAYYTEAGDWAGSHGIIAWGADWSNENPFNTSPSEIADESPFVPGEFVGIPAGARTGPYLMAYLRGPSCSVAGLRATGATLRGPSGPVQVARIGSDDKQIGAYLPPAMTFVIPIKPLVANTSYTARVTYSGRTGRRERRRAPQVVTFSFEAGPA